MKIRIRLNLLLAVGALIAILPVPAVEIIAHRGASYDAPENTISAFKLAFEQKADATELDVYLSKDGKIAVFHDVDLKRMAGLPDKVADLPLNELQKHNVADFGKWKGKGLKETIPTLSDALEVIPAGKRVFIELKSREEIIPALVKTLEGTTIPADRLPVITFHYETARAVKARLPKHEVSWLHSWSKDKPNPTVEELIHKAKEAKLDGLDLNYGFPIDKAFVEKVHAAGLKLYTWTVNDGEIARAQRDAGVDGITTDRPAWLREQLAR